MEDFYEHIDDFKEGLLSEADKARFESEMQLNKSLRIAVENYDDAKNLSEGLLELDMIDTLETLRVANEDSKETGNRSPDNIDRSEDISSHPPLKPSKTKEIKFDFRRLAMAASLIGVLALGTWWMLNNNSDKLDQDYVLANYIKPIDDDATKSVDTVGMTTFEKGKYFFALYRFEESEKWLKIMVAQEGDNKMRSQGYYWLGAAHIEQWEVDEARDAWEKSEEDGAVGSLGVLTDEMNK